MVIWDHPDSKEIYVIHPTAMWGTRYIRYKGKKLTNGEVVKYWGKWVVLGERKWLDQLAEKLDPYVEDEKISSIKYTKEPPKDVDIDECVMFVYCDKRERDEVWSILKEHGVKLKAWITEKETMEMWMPGGKLYERWIRSNNFNEKEIEAIKLDIQTTLGNIFNKPDEIYRPWGQ